MKRTLRILVSAMLAVCLLAMTACGSGKKDTYIKNINESATEVSDMTEGVNTTIQNLTGALQSGDQASYEESLKELEGHVEKLKELYHKIADEEAPEEYKEQQAQLKQYADDIDKMLDDSMEIYRLAIKQLDGSLTQEEANRVSELSQEITSLSSSTDSFDDILNSILGDVNNSK